MKTNKISAYILRGSMAALLFSCVIVALCSAIHLPEAAPLRNNAAFGASAIGNNQTLASQSASLTSGQSRTFTGVTAAGRKNAPIPSHRSMR